MNRIKVYVASTEELKNEELFRRLYYTVSETRRKKIDSMIFRKDKLLSLAVELLLMKGMSDVGMDSYTVRYGENGKPYVDGIYFNLSHSEEMVMCAVSSREVGCDVEKITNIDLDIARRFFFTTEYDMIAEKSTQGERCDMFFRLWTLKESFMKVTGLGMKLPLDAFRIDIDEDISVIQNVDENKYYFREYDLKDGYKYAVCGLESEFEDIEIVSFR